MKIKLVIAVIASCVSAFAALNFVLPDENETDLPPSVTPQPPKNPEETPPSKNTLESYLNSLTIDEKIGQLFIIDYRKSKFDSTLKNYLTTIKPGGFIFFKENFQNLNQTTTFINELTKDTKIPLFLSIDQEGGRVQRLKSMSNLSITNIPPMSEIGATSNYNLAYETGATIAKDLQKLKINLNFAPVLDIYSNPKNTVIGDRSFGSNPEIVSKMGLALAKGLQDNHVIPVYKHFPGHGDTSTDSHIELPIIIKTKEEILAFEAKPFIEAIANNAEIIMIGHLAIPSLTNDSTPASLSKSVITNFLKEELGYQNLVITDALNMKAITNNYSPKQIYELAINAGVDMLLMPSDPLLAFNSIKASLKEGTITEEQINKSVAKILTLKNKYLNFTY